MRRGVLENHFCLWSLRILFESSRMLRTTVGSTLGHETSGTLSNAAKRVHLIQTSSVRYMRSTMPFNFGWSYAVMWTSWAPRRRKSFCKSSASNKEPWMVVISSGVVDDGQTVVKTIDIRQLDQTQLNVMKGVVQSYHIELWCVGLPLTFGKGCTGWHRVYYLCSDLTKIILKLHVFL